MNEDRIKTVKLKINESAEGNKDSFLRVSFLGIEQSLEDNCLCPIDINVNTKLLQLSPDTLNVIDKVRISNTNINLKEVNLDVRYGKGSITLLPFSEGKTVDHVSVESALFLRDSYFRRYCISGSFNSSVFDAQGRLYVFFEKDNNISVAVSYDNGNVWYDFDGIIRLKKGETATRPYVLVDSTMKEFYLFYVLNGSYIAVKEISALAFDNRDAFIPYSGLAEWDENTEDDFGLTNFSEKGKSIRKSPSVIILGTRSGCMGQDILNEIEISKIRSENNKSYRFVIGMELQELEEDISNIIFTAYMSRNRKLRFLYLTNRDFDLDKSGGLLNIISSNNFFTWIKTHKNLRFAYIKKEPEPTTTNPDPNVEVSIYDDMDFSANFITQRITSISSPNLDRRINQIEAKFDSNTNKVKIVFYESSSLYYREFDENDINRTETVNKDEDFENFDIDIKNGVFPNDQWIIHNSIELSDKSENKLVHLLGPFSLSDPDSGSIISNIIKKHPCFTGNEANPLFRPAIYLTSYNYTKIFYYDKYNSIWSIVLCVNSIVPLGCLERDSFAG